MDIRLTEILATLEPATGGKKIRDLVRSGVNVFRLNLSHGGHEVLTEWIKWIRDAEKELKTFVGILLDLQGPKVRVGRFKEGFIVLHGGQRITFTTEKLLGDENIVPVQFGRFPKEVKKGDRVYLDDGNFCVRVIKIHGRKVDMEVEVGGRLSDFKGLNLPDAVITTSPLTFLDDIGDLLRMLKQKRYVRSGDRVVIATGVPHDIPQWTNVIRVEVVP
jgi:pyruvate kinase